MVATPAPVLLLCVCALGVPTPQVIDLGYPVDENSRVYPYPGLDPFTITKKVINEYVNGIPWFTFKTFQVSEHVSTHVDAPFNMVKHGWKLGEIPFHRFFTLGVLIDVSGEVNGNNEFELLPSHIEAWEEQHGAIPPGCIVLIRYGWAELYYDNRELYYGLESNDSTEPNFPGMLKETAELLVSRKVYGVGVDTGSLDRGKDSQLQAHQSLFGANIYGIINMKLLSNDLPARGFQVSVMPLKMPEGTGAPARVLAHVTHQPFGDAVSWQR